MVDEAELAPGEAAFHQLSDLLKATEMFVNQTGNAQKAHAERSAATLPNGAEHRLVDAEFH